MILALDIATRVGFAFGEIGASPTWGSRDFSDKHGTGAIIGKFRVWLCEQCYRLKPSLVVYEAPYVARGKIMNAHTTERLHGMICTAMSVAWELRIDYQREQSATIRKFLTGHARHGSRAAGKAAVLAACLAMGFDVGTDDDAGDALALWLMIEAQLDPSAGMRRGNGALLPASSGKTHGNDRRRATSTPPRPA